MGSREVLENQLKDDIETTREQVDELNRQKAYQTGVFRAAYTEAKARHVDPSKTTTVTAAHAKIKKLDVEIAAKTKLMNQWKDALGLIDRKDDLKNADAATETAAKLVKVAGADGTETAALSESLGANLDKLGEAKSAIAQQEFELAKTMARGQMRAELAATMQSENLALVEEATSCGSTELSASDIETLAQTLGVGDIPANAVTSENAIQQRADTGWTVESTSDEELLKQTRQSSSRASDHVRQYNAGMRKLFATG
jgi:hypothetical protein